MKKIFWAGGIIAVILLAKSYISTGSKLTNLKITPQNLKYVKQAGIIQNLTSQKFKVNFAVENPNEKPLTLNRLSADVLYKGKSISTIYISKNVKLNPRETTILEGVEFSVSVLKVGTEIFNFITKKSKLGSLDIKGTITAEGLKFPIDETITV